MRFLISMLVLFVAGSVNAAPLTWTLNGVTFDDGTSLIGQFDYDAETNVYSNVMLQTQASPYLIPFEAGNTYTTTHVAVSRTYLLGLRDLNPTLDGQPGNKDLSLNFGIDLTKEGGVLDIVFGYESVQSRTMCLYPFETCVRYITAGSISAVPVPAAVWMFGSALAGLGWLRRRKTA